MEKNEKDNKAGSESEYINYIKEQIGSNNKGDDIKKFNLSKLIAILIVIIIFFALGITLYSYISGVSRSNYYDEKKVNEIYQNWVKEEGAK